MSTSAQYVPGDVVNGHRLSGDGTRWEPLDAPESVPPFLGHKIKPHKIDRELAKVRPYMSEDETLLALFRLANFRPAVDLLAVTDQRLLGFNLGKLEIEVPARAASQSDLDARGWLQAGDYNGKPMVFKLADELDRESLLGYLGVQDTISMSLARLPDEDARPNEGQPIQTRREQVASGLWPQTQVVGDTLKKKPSIAIDELCHGDDPWLILSAGSAGVLAAWDDRLAIVKTGGMAGIMAGAMMGGRTAVFHFTDVTGIEYNSGMVNGVLEVLTPSYSGSANKDFWRGSASGRNSDSNDPWTLSNTLPLDKFSYREVMPQIAELRARISRAKQPAVTLQNPVPTPASGVGLAEELLKLAALRDAAVLTEAEFAAAKASLLP